ncbi:unnamed protein product [Lathyrus sativus]|nr:unnamed protein product [Lathyrus sativus]
MANWRRNQGIRNHQVGHRRSSSYGGNPPLYNRYSTVPLWEEKFYATVGQVPWRRLLESHSNVMKWEDSAVKQAFYDAKFRFCAEINGYRWDDIPLLDPDMYIDEVDWDACVDPELYLDLEREEEARHILMEKRQQESEIVDNPFDHGWEIKPTGWGEEDENVTKPQEASYGAEGWIFNNHANNETNSWEQNDYHFADLQNKYQEKYDEYDRRKNAYRHGNQYKMNRGRRNRGKRGGRRENITYVAKAATPRSQ